MPHRISATAALAAVATGSVSISALVIFIYLKLCSRRPAIANAEKKQEPEEKQQEPVEAEYLLLENQEPVPDNLQTELSELHQSPSPESTENVRDMEQIESEQFFIQEGFANFSAWTVEQSVDSKGTEESAEESVSECEDQLEEAVLQSAAGTAETAEQTAAGEGDPDEAEEEGREILAELEQEVAKFAEEVKKAEEMSATDTVENSHSNKAMEKLLQLQMELGKLEIDGEGSSSEQETASDDEGNRVVSWLARNDQFSVQLKAKTETDEQQQRLDDRSDDGDSGRPVSSVDTVAGVSPRSQHQNQQVRELVTQDSHHREEHVNGDKFLDTQLSPNQGHQLGEEEFCQDVELKSLVTMATGMESSAGTDGEVLGQSRPPDRRSSVIRGVSPLPGDDNDVIHQFLIPNKLGGSMVGTRGRNISYIRAKSGASVWISRNFFDKKTQIVNVRGPVECVRAALQVIKRRFPELDVKPINTAVPIQRNPALQPAMCQLTLPAGSLIEVHACAMYRGTTVFLQQPGHPSYSHLDKMDRTIMKHYGLDPSSVPCLPRPVNPGAVCIAPFGAAWHRAIIADVFPEDDMVLMKYLDWGGYERMPVGCLKQIRTEMMHLPFQSVEAHLAYVTPVLCSDLSLDQQLEHLSRTLQQIYLSGKRVKCQVVYYNDLGQPCVYLYTSTAAPTAASGDCEDWKCLQEELVRDGLVQWFQGVAQVTPQVPQQP